ncbi:hypothetical protein scyTo_0001221 [Scyliorhinus torazame]|uniref:Guanylate kinase-like domain-containing protein n=1 Tax=Scyliorhinus torazame TaxID=75743 RepID=A0A401PAQ8_SCYTO|nr:hypothetical protein [Scyliorhinus torazame]
MHRWTISPVNQLPIVVTLLGTTRPPKEGEVPGVDYNFVTVEEFMELEKSGSLLESGTYEDNYYGTPKPPAEPTPVLLNVTDQILPGARPSSEGKRKRNKSVSNMEKAGIAPPEEEEEEEEEEERPIVNGNGTTITPGSHNTKTTSWLDPRLGRKAKLPEECKDDGDKLQSGNNGQKLENLKQF